MNLSNGYEKNQWNKLLIGVVSIISLLCCCISSSILLSSVASSSSSQISTVNVSEIYTQAFETAEIQVYRNQTETAAAFPTLTLTIEPTFTETSVPTPTSVWSQIDKASCIPNHAPEEAKVIEVVDGDTIKVYLNEKIYSVRYIGIDTPEKQKDYYSLEAQLKNSEFVLGKTVYLVKDTSETDQFGRLLRYVVADNNFVNYLLVEKGYARAVEYPPDTACKIFFEDAQQLAEKSLLGLWQPTAVVPIIINTPSTSLGANCSPAYPGVCIPPSPPDLDCKDIPYRRFNVLPPDPHRFDGDGDGIGCES